MYISLTASGEGREALLTVLLFLFFFFVVAAAVMIHMKTIHGTHSTDAMSEFCTAMIVFQGC